jgi:hypothetical protein
VRAAAGGAGGRAHGGGAQTQRHRARPATAAARRWPIRRSLERITFLPTALTTPSTPQAGGQRPAQIMLQRPLAAINRSLQAAWRPSSCADLLAALNLRSGGPHGLQGPPAAPARRPRAPRSAAPMTAAYAAAKAKPSQGELAAACLLRAPAPVIDIGVNLADPCFDKVRPAREQRRLLGSFPPLPRRARLRDWRATPRPRRAAGP